MADYRDWDRVYRESRPEDLPWELGRPRDFLVEHVESGRIKPGRALDICCGLGTNSLYLARSGFNVSGIDISQTAIGRAREKAREQGLEADFRIGNALDLPYPDHEFDFVLDVGCFHSMHPEDEARFLSELTRVLKPGPSPGRISTASSPLPSPPRSSGTSNPLKARMA